MYGVDTTSVFIGFLCLVAGAIIGLFIYYKRTKTLQQTHNKKLEHIGTADKKVITAYDRAVKCYEKNKRRRESKNGKGHAEYGSR